MPTTPVRTKRAKVKLSDLAKAAGVSLSTASLAVRNDPIIRPELRRQISELRERMGYVPLRRSSAAIAAGTSHKLLFSLVDRSLEEDPYSAILNGVIFGCRRRGCALTMSDTDGTVPPDKDAHRNLAGVILAGVVTEDIVEAYRSRGLAVVVVGAHHFSSAVHSVQVDLFEAARMTVRRALEDGARHFVYFAKNLETDVGKYFLLYLRSTLEDHGLELPAPNVFLADYRDEARVSSQLERLGRHLRPDTAVFTNGLEHADVYRTFLALSKRNSRVYSISYSDSPINHRNYPCLNIDLNQAGRIAVDRLCLIIEADDDDAPDCYTCLLRPDGWLPRASVAQ
ncbi:hypothetical protein OPIT5_10895 [Opitutaceae bacterium TAV5]|nr:hypothetical protein OPIT5_10895 [Opitutaceae bacterium TAV5]